MSVRWLLVWLLAATPVIAGESATNSTPGKTETTVKLSFDTLKKWAYFEDERVPDFIKKLDGLYVEMIGYMMAPDAAENISDFVLVPALYGCCFGQPPAVNHVVLVKMSGTSKSKYYDDAIIVRGRFHVGEQRVDGELVSLYRLDADEVKAK